MQHFSVPFLCMQTFFNPTTPFFDAEGHPMVGARVSFLDLSTNASLIELTDSEGTPLPNPLFTGSDGRLRLENGNGAPAVPCIADGLSYKVVVAKKTGVEPIFMGGILQNPEELYEEPFIAFIVTAMGGSGSGADTAIVGSVADVRLADKTLGAVVCSGYYEEGDCPARVFTWVESREPPQDNGINILRNPEDNTGYWKMSDPPAGTWDVRMAGVLVSETPELNAQRLTALLNLVPSIYFPTGNWALAGGFTCKALVIESGVRFIPSANDYDRVICADILENRGGYFCAFGDNSSDKRVRIVTKSPLHTSWFMGTLNEFLSDPAIATAKEIVFDSNYRNGSTSITISNKLVKIFDGVTIGNTIRFSDCIMMYYGFGSLEATSFSISSVTAGVTLDLAGLRMGDSNSNVEVNHAGMVAKNSDETFTMAIDFEKLQFSGTQGQCTLRHSSIEFAASGNKKATLSGNGLVVSKGEDDDEEMVSIDNHGIDSTNPIEIREGALTPWTKINPNNSEIINGIFTINDDYFDTSKRLFINAQHATDYRQGYDIKITAEAIPGRIIRVYCNADDPYDPAFATNHKVGVMNANNLYHTTLMAGGSVTLKAYNNGWVLDPWSV